MADTPQHNISPGQLAVFLVSAQLGLGIFGVVRHAVERVGHAGWLLLPGMGLLSLLGVVLICVLCRRFESSIVEINRRVLGRVLGAAVNGLLLLSLVAATAAHHALYLQVMRIFFFQATPFPVLVVFLILPMIYMVAKGLKTVARFDSFVHIAILSLLGMFAVGWNQTEWTFLQPWLTLRTGAFLPTVLRLGFSFTGFELLLIVYPRVRGGQMRAGLAAAGTTAAILTAFTVFNIAYFGERYINKQVFSLLTLVQSLEAPVLERLEIYFLMIWLPAMGSTTTAFFAATQLAAAEIFPRIPYRWLLGMLSAATVGATLLLSDFNTVRYLVNLIGAIDLAGLGLFLPAVLWLLAAVRGLRA